MPYNAITVKKCSPHIGAEIGGGRFNQPAYQ
jgi:hypothetical protein